MKQNRQPVHKAADFKRRLLCVAVASAFGGVAYANPTGPQVVNGQASFAQQGNTLSITNSPNAIINWQSFSIGQPETTRFLQQSASSAVLNRVVGIDPSIILGTLQSNGKVFLINPSGILFGKGSRVDVAGLVASTLNMSNQDFLAGRLNFATGSVSAGGVTNQGTITTPSGGSVILVAPQVENSGIINAPNGDVILAAGRSVRLGDTGAPNVLVEIQAPDTQAVNVGEIVVGGGSASIYAGLINQRGIVKADAAVMGENGKVTFRATKSLNLESGSITSASGGAQGGTVSLEAPVFYQIGDVHADGATGGSVLIQAGNLLQSGAVTADGTQGKGGNVTLNVTNAIQTQSALLSARGGTAGGKIVVNAGADQNGELFSSATYLTTGTQGGEINLLGHDITLLGATADASGKAGGGTILVGGDYQGKNPAVANADTTWINYSTTLRADAGTTGAGGKVVVWSENDTRFAGYITARGGANSGDGGLIEVSGKENLMFAGMADASAANGKSGMVLLDPKNIVIDSTAGGLSSFQLLDPHPGANELFGQQTVVLPNDNVVVTDPNDSFAASSAGAVYLFNGGTGALMSALTGTKDNDSVGSGGITQLFISGNYVVSSPNWNGTAGAATWGSGTGGVSGVVSDANSLVGSTPGDFVGSNIFQLFNSGNYLVLSPDWTNAETSAPFAGAVTWVDGTTGNIAGSPSPGGAVSAANSLVGSTMGDRVGSNGIFPLFNSGNYLVLSPDWTNGGADTNVGAVTWGNGTTGVSGVVSSANSLVGSATNDSIGSGGIRELAATGNYLVLSPTWTNGGAGTNVGAVTWGSGTTGVIGVVSATTSLVGSTPGDAIGSNDVIELSSGNYLVFSPNWTNGTAAAAGAVTFGSGAEGVMGEVSATNSLVGSAAEDRVGGSGVFLLSSGNYLVLSPNWTNGGAGPNVGAVTWGSGTIGVNGEVSAGNSLVGSSANDSVGGDFGVLLLGNGNYVVSSPHWNSDTGAVTWGSGTGGVRGVVSPTNSLVGSTAGDLVGSGGVTELITSGNYVVASPNWDGTSGAVTWGSGTAGVSGVVSSTNSLVGSTAGDLVGSGGITELTINGNYLVLSGTWNGNAGAVTWGSGTDGVSGVVSSANSLVGGTAGDLVGSGGIIRLDDSGNYVVSSPNWANGAATAAGAVTFGSGATGVSGAVSATNSLVGSAAGDGVGSRMVELANSNYVVVSPGWNSGMGAVTFATQTSGIVGTVSSANSLVGSLEGDSVGSIVTPLINGNYVVNSPDWNGNAGAVTWGSGTTGVSGVVSPSNSLVGSTAGDLVGSGGIHELFTSGNYLVLSPNWTNVSTGASSAGAVTWVDGTTGNIAGSAIPGGAVSTANSLVGSTNGDSVGEFGSVTELSNGNYVVKSATWTNIATGASFAGAVTFGSGTDGVKGIVSSDNSLVGSKAGDRVGFGFDGITELFATGNYLVKSPNWNGNAGAVTWVNGTTGNIAGSAIPGGVVSSTNSLVGSAAGDSVGSGGITQLFNSDNYLVLSPNWNGNAGAVTFGSGTTGVFGEVSAANSLVGTTSGDAVGSGGILQLFTNGNYLVLSPNWNGNAGAVTFGSGETGISGAVSAANSLVGANADDQIGSGGIFQLLNGNFVVSSPVADKGALVDAGLVQVVTFGVGGGSAPASGQNFDSNPDQNVTIAPAAITAITNTGTAVVLQANNDITLNPVSDVITSAGGNGGAITLEAGRSILLKSSITTDNGNLVITANHPGADPDNRDAGPGRIKMEQGTTLNAGTGNVTLTVGSGVAGAESGDLVVDKIVAANVELRQNGNTDGSSILRASSSSLIQATSLLMEVAGGLATGGSIGTEASPILTSGVTRLVTGVNGAGETAVSNSNGADGAALVVQTMRSVGGNIRLINDTDIDVTAGSFCDCIRGIISDGGNIYLNSTGGGITGSDEINATATSLSSASFPNGGRIDITAAQNIDLTGPIRSDGYSQFSGDTSSTGQGGFINIHAGGDVILGSVSAVGGDAAQNSITLEGGRGGDIVISGGGSIAIDSLNASGGFGADGNGENFNAGAGGVGGTIAINTSSADTIIQVGSAFATGGDGGIRGTDTFGPVGGHGGTVEISSTAAGANVAVSVTDEINVSGGGGGSSDSGNGGDGGNGGSIAIYMANGGTLTLNAGLQLSTRGGGGGTEGVETAGAGGAGGSVFISSVSGVVEDQIDPGTAGGIILNGVAIDVAGGVGSNDGAQGFVDFQSGDGGITQTGALAINSTNVRISSSGDVILDNLGNAIPGVWGNVGGNMEIVTSTPLQLVPVEVLPGTLNVGGNLKATSTGTAGQFAANCALVSCNIVHGDVSVGGSVTFYSDDLYIVPPADSSFPGTVSTGLANPAINYLMWAPWTPGTNVLLDNLTDLGTAVHTPRLIFGDPHNLGAIGTLNWTASIATPGELGPIQKIEVYATDINFEADLGNFGTGPLPLSLKFDAASGINVGAGLVGTPFTTIYLGDNQSLSLTAGVSGVGDLTIGGTDTTTLKVGETTTNPGGMLLSGRNIQVLAVGSGDINLLVSGTGAQTLQAQDSIFIEGVAAGNVHVRSAAGVQTLTTTSPLLQPLPSLKVSAEFASSGGVFVETEIGQQVIDVAGGVTVTSGAGATTIASIHSAGNQTVDAGWVRLTSTGGSSSADLFSEANQTITTTAFGPAGWGIAVVNSGSTGNTFLGSNGVQVLNVRDSNGIVVGGGSPGRSSIGGNFSQTITIEGIDSGNLLLISAAQGEVGVYSNGTQDIVAGQANQRGGVTVNGGTVDGANANVYGGAGQIIRTSGDLQLIGGSDPIARVSAVINTNSTQDITANSVTVRSIAGPFSNGFFAPSGPQTITTTGAGPNGYGLTLENLGANGIDQGNFPTSAFIDGRSGAQTIDVADSKGILISGLGGHSVLAGEGTTQKITIHGTGQNRLDLIAGAGDAVLLGLGSGGQTITAGSIQLTGGSSVGAQAQIQANSGPQVISAGSISLQGGTANNAPAVIAANSGAQEITVAGALTLTGGSALGPDIPDLANPPTDCGAVSACAVVIARTGKQTIIADSISITGGSAGNENLATIRGDIGQDVTIGSGGLTMQGGSGTGLRNYAFFENYADDQILRFTEGAPLSLTGGTDGIKHFAAIMAMGDSTSQQILGNPAITLTGGANGGGDGSGFFTTFTGNNAYIGTDPFGSVTTSQTIQAQSIDLLGGAGPNNAAIDNFRSGGQQSITVFGDVRLLGRSGASASIESFGSQDITANNGGGVLLQGGTSNYSGAWIFAHSGTQSINTTGQLSLIAGSALANGQGLFNCGGGGACALVANLQEGSDPLIVNQSVTAMGGIVVTGGNGGAYNEAALFTHGSQEIHAPGGILIQGGAGAGNYASIAADRNGYTQMIDFGSGNVQVIGGSSGGRSFGTIYSGGSQLISGQGNIVISGGVLPNAGVPATLNTPTGQDADPVVYSWAEITGNGGSDPLASQKITANSISITTQLGQSSSGIFSPAGTQQIKTTSNSTGYGISIRNLGATGIDQNGFEAAAYIATRTGTQSIEVVNSKGVLIEGVGGTAIIDGEGPSQTITIHGTGANQLDVFAAGGLAQIYSEAASQSISAGLGAETGSISIHGGTQSGAIGQIYSATGTQTITTTGMLSLVGGTAPAIAPFNLDQLDCLPACASLHSQAGLQTIDAGSILVKGGASGSENLASIRSNAGQTITVAGSGGLQLIGGGEGGTSSDYSNFAIIENYSGAQTIHFLTPGATLDVKAGGVGMRQFAGIYQAAIDGGGQKIEGTPVITVAGGAGGSGAAGPDRFSFSSNLAFIASESGEQRINAQSIDLIAGGSNFNVADIVNQGGDLPGSVTGSQFITISGAINVTGGGAADAYSRIYSRSGDQTISAGSLSLTGGTQNGAFALIEVASGTQTITFGTGGLKVDAGTATADNHWAKIFSAENQLISGTGDISLTGGVAGFQQSFAEISASTGQDIKANSISITALAGPSSTGLWTTSGLQKITTTGSVANGYGLTIRNLGATGPDQNGASGSGAYISTGTGSELIEVVNSRGILLESDGDFATIYTDGVGSTQTISIHGSGANELTILAHSGAADVVGVTQNITAGQSGETGSIQVAGGTADGATARIAALGNQNITSAGAISLTGGNAPSTSAEISSDRTQIIVAGGSITLTGGTASSASVRIGAAGSQDITAVNLSMNGGSGADGANALIDSGTGSNQTFHLSGDLLLTGGTVGVDNFASIESGANQTITAVNIVLTGGASGGSLTLPDLGNTADIAAESGTQTITASNLSLLGGAGIESGAGLPGLDQNIVLTSALTLTGGTGPGAIAAIGSSLQPVTIAINAGSVSMTAGSGEAGPGGYSAGALIGAIDGQNANVNIQASGNVTLTSAATSSAAIGSDTGGGTIVVNSSGGNVATDVLSQIRGDGVSLSAGVDLTVNGIVSALASDIDLFATAGKVFVGSGTSFSTGTGIVNLNTPKLFLSSDFTIPASGWAFNSLAGKTIDGVTPATTLTNLGTLAFSSTTMNTALNNQGAIKAFSINNLIQGALANQGSVTVEPGGSLVLFGPATNAASGTIVITANDGAGSSSFSSMTVAGTLDNAGTVELRSDASNGFNASLIVGSTGTVNNSGTIHSMLTGIGTSKPTSFINPAGTNGTLINTGMFQADSPTTVSLSTFDTSAGALQIAAGQTLNLAGTGTVVMGTGTSFGTGSGTIDLTGTETLRLASSMTLPSVAALQFSGNVTITSTGPVTLTNLDTLTLGNDTITANVNLDNQGTVVVAAGAGSTINGGLSNTSTGTIRVAGNNSPTNATLTVANGFVNDGRIELEAASNGGIGILNVSSGTLTNAATGVIRSQTSGVTTASNQLNAPVTNLGLIDVAQDLAITGTLIIPSTATGLAITGAGTLTLGDLTVNATNVANQPIIGGTGMLVTNGTSTINGGQLHVDGRDWNNFGDLTVNGRVTFDNGVLLTNEAPANLILAGTNAAPLAQGAGTGNAVVNAGTLDKTSTATQTIALAFDNSGTVNVNSGVLQLAGDGVHTGSIVANAGAELGFTGGTHVLNAGAAISGAGVVRVNGATLDANTSIATATSFVMQSGLLSGTGNLTFDGSFTLAGGTIGGTGTLTTNGTSTINNGTAHLDGRGWNNFNNLTVNGRVTLDNGAVLTNEVGGALTLAGTNAVPIAGGVGLPSTFDNAGTVIKTSTTPQTITVAAFNNSGTLDLTGGALTVGGAFNWTGGTVFGTSTNSLTTTGASTLSGNDKTLDGVTWINAGTGTVDWNGSGKLIITNSASLVNDGAFTVTGDGSIDALSGTNRFVNNGTFSKTGGAGLLLVHGSTAPLFFDNYGLVDLQSGSLQIPGGVLNGTLNVDPGLQITLNDGTNQFGDGALITGGGTVAFLPGAGGSISFDGTTTGTTVAAGSSLVITGADVGGTGTLVNQGTLTLGSNSFSPVIDNQGSVNIATGTLALNSGGTGTGSYNVASGALLDFVAGTYTLGSVTGAGDVDVRGAAVSLANNSAMGSLDVSSGALSIGGGAALDIGGVLNLTGGTLGGTGAVSANILNWSGGTISAGTLTTLAEGTTSLSGTGGKAFTGGTWNNLGTVTWTAGNVTLGSGAVLNNQTGGVVSFQNAGIADDFNGAGTFNNFGTVVVNSAVNDSSIHNTFNNFGTVNVNVGVLRLENGGSDSGAYDIAGGAQLLFRVGNRTITGGISGPGDTVFESGMVAVNGTYNLGGTTRITGGTANFNTASSSSVLAISAGTLGGSGDVDVGTLNQTGGTLVGTGSVTASELNLSGGSLNGTGSLTVTSNFAQNGGNVGGNYQQLALAHQGDFLVQQQSYSAQDTLALAASGLITVDGRSLSAPNVILFGGTGVTLRSSTSAQSLVDATTSLKANGTTSLNVNTPSLLLDGTNGPAKLQSAGTMNLTVGSVNVTAGAFAANIDPTTLSVTATGNIVLTGGSGNNAFAKISGNDVTVSGANIILNGGSGNNSFAVIEATPGNATVTAVNHISLIPGTGLNADASLLAPPGQLTVIAQTCTGCVVLAADPRLDPGTNQGLFGANVVLGGGIANPGLPQIEVDNSIIYAVSLTGQSGQANTIYSTSGTETTEEEKKEDTQKSGDNKDSDNAKAPKRNLPVCM